MGERDRIYILKEHREIYKKITSRGAFGKASNSEVFMMCLGLGLRTGIKKPFGKNWLQERSGSGALCHRKKSIRRPLSIISQLFRRFIPNHRPLLMVV